MAVNIEAAIAWMSARVGKVDGLEDTIRDRQIMP